VYRCRRDLSHARGSLHKSFPPIVFNDVHAFAKGDWCPGPSFAGCQVGRLRELEVFDPSQVLYDVLALGIPHVDAVSKTRAIVYRHLSLPQSSSASRFMAGYPADRCSAHCYAVGLDKRAFKNTAVFKSGHNEIQNRPLASKTRKDPAPVPSCRIAISASFCLSWHDREPTLRIFIASSVSMPAAAPASMTGRLPAARCALIKNQIFKFRVISDFRRQPVII
jgi:hypothetical protein